MNTSTLADLIRRANAGAFDPNHPTVDLKWGSAAIAVDKKIAPLVRKLWDAGIATTASCQGGGDLEAYIGFPGLEQVRAFLRRCPAATRAAVVDRITEGRLTRMSCDGALQCEEDGPALFYAIRFAHSDLEAITAGFH